VKGSSYLSERFVGEIAFPEPCQPRLDAGSHCKQLFQLGDRQGRDVGALVWGHDDQPLLGKLAESDTDGRDADLELTGQGAVPDPDTGSEGALRRLPVAVGNAGLSIARPTTINSNNQPRGVTQTGGCPGVRPCHGFGDQVVAEAKGLPCVLVSSAALAAECRDSASAQVFGRSIGASPESGESLPHLPHSVR
jgi:hypothetical protein